MPVNRRNIRTTRHIQDSDSSDSEEESKTQLETTDSSNGAPLSHSMLLSSVKEMQKLRQRQHGLSATELALGVPIKQGKANVGEDESSRKTGGLVTASNPDQEDVEAILLGKNFAHETNKRDEDKEMLKFIEKELSKRRGEELEDEGSPPKKSKLNKFAVKTNELLNEAVPEHLRPTLAQRNTKEGMLSQQMLCGIPEVDLGLDAKMRNIIATEEAKQKLLQQQRQKQHSQEPSILLLQALSGKLSSKSGSVGDGLAKDDQLGTVDYVQHKRWREPYQRIRDKVTANPPTTSQINEGHAPEPLTDISSAELHKLESAKSTDLIHLRKFREQELRRMFPKRK